MGHSRLYPDNPLSPSEANFKYTKDGLLIHDQDFPGFDLVERQWKWDQEEIRLWMKSKNRFAVIAVNDNSHFVFGYYTGILGTWCIDPLDGKLKLLKRHYTPCGSLLFCKT
jgi:hypothetical protein